jgi:hypothetical protein
MDHLFFDHFLIKAKAFQGLGRTFIYMHTAGGNYFHLLLLKCPFDQCCPGFNGITFAPCGINNPIAKVY